MNVRDQQRYRRRRQQQLLATSSMTSATTSTDQEEQQYQQQQQQQEKQQQQQEKQQQDRKQQIEQRQRYGIQEEQQLSALKLGGGGQSKHRQQQQQQQERQQQERSQEHERIYQEHERSQQEYQQRASQQEQQRVSQEHERVSQEHERICEQQSEQQQTHSWQQRPQQQQQSQSQQQRPRQQQSHSQQQRPQQSQQQQSQSRQQRPQQQQQSQSQQQQSQSQQQQRPQQQQSQRPPHVQSLQLSREQAYDPPAKKGIGSTFDPPAKKGTNSHRVVGSDGDSSYYASYLSMPIPSSPGGMVSVLELLSIDEDDSCNNFDGFGNNSNNVSDIVFNNNADVNAGTRAQIETSAAESKQHAADVAAIVQSMIVTTADGEDDVSEDSMFHGQSQKDIGELRGKVDDQLRTMLQDNQKDVQQWNTQLQLLQQSRERQQGQTTSLAQQQQQQQPLHQVKRLAVVAPPKQKDLVSSYTTPKTSKAIATTKSVSYSQQRQQLPPQQQQQSRQPSKQPPRPQPTQRMPPSLSARADELVSLRSVALVDTASSTDQSASTPWCLDMESATQDLLHLTGPRKVHQPREVLDLKAESSVSNGHRQQQQQQPQRQEQEPVTIDGLEPSFSRDVTVAADNLSGKREEDQGYQKHVNGSRNKASYYAKMLGKSSDVSDRDGLPVESSPSRFSRLGSNQSRAPQEDPILSARRSKMASKQKQPMVLQLDERVMNPERDEHDNRLSDNRFHPDQPATPVSTAAVVPTPREKRPSKEKSDSPPLTRVSSDLSLREEGIRQDREERYQLEQQMKIQEQSRENKKQGNDELLRQQEQLLQSQHQEQSQQKQYGDFLQQKPQLQGHQQKPQPREQQEQSESSQGSRRFFPPDEAANISEQEEAYYEHEGATADEAAFIRKISKQQEANNKESRSQSSEQVEAASFPYGRDYLEIIQVPTSPRQSDIIQVPTSPAESVEVSVWNEDLAGPVSSPEEVSSLVQPSSASTAERSLFQVQEHDYEGSSSGSIPADYYYDNSDKVLPLPTNSDAHSWTSEPLMDRQQSSKDELVEVSVWNEKLAGPVSPPEEVTSLVQPSSASTAERPLFQVQEHEYEGSSSGSIPADYYYENSDKVLPLPTNSDAHSWTNEPIMGRQQSSKDDASPVSSSTRTDAPVELRVPQLSASRQRSLVPKQVGSTDSSEGIVSTRDKAKRNEQTNAKGSSGEVAAVSTLCRDATKIKSPVQGILSIDVGRKDEPRRSLIQGSLNEESPSSAVEDRRCVSPVHFMRENTVAPSTPEEKKEEHEYEPVYSPRSPDAKEDVPAHPQVTKDVIKIEHVRLKALEDPYGDKGQYTGMLVRRKPHGQGTMQYEDGRCYTGDFKYGRWHGNGRALFSNGDLYVGEYDMDQRHGKGRYEWEDGRMYDGTFHRDQRQGTGTYSWADGAVYTGDFFAGQRHGHGTYKFVDGSVYIGEWRSGKYHGVGECKWADARYYRGEWENGRAHGYGKETRPDGTVRHDGEWKNDRPVREKK